ncbi:MAG: DUF1385 domain-containing protein [Eggerthellaceae bacterium]|nr:DUF1385 domain-containing protein [Eggerthellaceae bacterium]MEE1477740.1 DUF1385 domain-containing protein [Eggerthellaceae bacterium]
MQESDKQAYLSQSQMTDTCSECFSQGEYEASAGNEKAREKSDLARAFSEDGPCKTHIGGQALIEGVMMRGKNCWAIGVREPDGGLFSQEYPLSKKGNRPTWFSWPLVRGCVALVDSLALGFKALEIAANKAFDDEEEVAESPASNDPESFTQNDSELPALNSPKSCLADAGSSALNDMVSSELSTSDSGLSSNLESASTSDFGLSSNLESASVSDSTDEGVLSKAEMTFAMVLGVVLAVALFILLPAGLSNVIVGEYEQNPFVWNIVDGVVRVAIFIFYVWLIGRMPDIKRMFSYHGAEHKTIHCYEHGLELTPENARQFPRLHVRCGTAFLIMVMLIAIVVYTVIPLDGVIASLGITGTAAFALLLVVRLVFLPVIAGISYEITVKWAGSHPENPLVKVVLWPGMQMQRLTTNEPDDSMLECAIAAMKLVVANEETISKKLS